MNKQHNYKAEIKWTGNRGTGTSGYREYDRHHLIKIEGKVDIHASSDPAFQGDKLKHNPEDLFVVSFSECHMLWYLHLCADAGIIVIDYTDHVTGILEEDPVNGGRFISVTLNPVVVVTEKSMIEKANALHHEANKKCFMSNSVNFPVNHRPKCVVWE
jgi:organic hydroperoxide reductase OsmC/OhrA